MPRGYGPTARPMDGGMTGNTRAQIHAQAGAAMRAQVATQGAKSGAGGKWSANAAHRNKVR